MFLLRISRAAPAARVAALSSTASKASFSTIPRRFATSDYGSGDQNSNTSANKATSDKEHPGPAPPSTGSSGGSKSEASSSGQVQSSGSSSNGGKAQPKILNEAPPKESQQSEEVRKHNEDFNKRADRPVEKS